MQLNDRELVTILGALRVFQGLSSNHSLLGLLEFNDSPPPLTSKEIDDLCERLDPEESALRQRSDNEYSLKPNHCTCWIEVNNVSVYIKRNDDNCAVAIYPVGKEDREALAETYVPYREAEETDDENR